MSKISLFKRTYLSGLKYLYPNSYTNKINNFKIYKIQFIIRYSFIIELSKKNKNKKKYLKLK